MSTLVDPAPVRPIPRSEEVKRFFYENAVLGQTRRYRQLDRYEAHYACLQYRHLQHDWWGLSADQMETVSPEIQVPLGFTQPAVALSVRAKRPTAPYNLAKAIVDRFTGLLFSESRRPFVAWEGDPDTEDFMIAAMEQMRFWAKWREARTMGGALGSVMVTAHVRDGRFSLEIHNPKHMQVVWRDRRTLTPLAALKLYRYPVEEDSIDERTGEVKGTKIVDYLYRRIITETDDTVYLPVKLEPGARLDWVVESTVQHGLGFFPGVWVQNLPVLEQEDGDPDCHGSWQNFDTIDRILAQMNKAVLLNMDPTLALSVDAKQIASIGTVATGSDTSLQLGSGGSAQYLEISGSGIEAGRKVYDLLKQNTLDVCRCVLVDPQTLSGAAQSAKAIEYIYAPMLEKADDLRAQYGDLGVLPLLKIIEAIARKLSGRTVSLPSGKTARIGFDLPLRRTEEGKMVPRVLGAGGQVTLQWGPYFAPTEDDVGKAVSNLVNAKSGGLVDQETAVKQAAPLFGVRDPQAMMAKIKDEQEAEMAQMMGGMDGGVAPGDVAEESTPPAGAGGKP